MVEFDFFNNEKYITKLLFLIEISNTLLLRQFMHSALFCQASFIFPRQKKVIRKLASYYLPLMSELGEARHFAILFTSFENSLYFLQLVTILSLCCGLTASDYFHFDDLLTLEEQTLRKKVRECMEKEIAPVMTEVSFLSYS